MYFKINKLCFSHPKITEKYKITQIADLHFSNTTTTKRLNKIKQQLNNTKPDYICIVGDTIDHTELLKNKNQTELLKQWLIDLAINPVMISIGNHDYHQRRNIQLQYDFWPDVKNLHKNIHLLHNNIYEDKNITFMGLTQKQDYYTKKKEDKESMIRLLEEHKELLELQKGLGIALIHSPLCLKEEKISTLLQHYSLILSGHTHNGLVLPVLDELWKSNTGIIEPNKKLIAKNARGILTLEHEKTDDTFVNISGGITKISTTSPQILRPLNALFPASIDTIELLPGKKPKLYQKGSYYTKS